MAKKRWKVIIATAKPNLCLLESAHYLHASKYNSGIGAFPLTSVWITSPLMVQNAVWKISVCFYF